MDKRKIQITGGSTYMVTLPKSWAEKVGLDAGTEVSMIDMPPDLMVIRPETVKTKESRSGKMEVGDKSGENLVRSIISFYIAGYEVLKIDGQPITSQQRNTIRKVTQSLIGPEIVEESSNQVVIRNLSDLSELSITETLSRIHQISRSMFKDSIEALLELNKELARDVEDRDDDVDRLFLAISRRFRVMLFDIIEKSEDQISRVEYFDYQRAAKQLERIADHSKKIASIISSLEIEVSGEIADRIKNSADEATELVDKSIISLTERDIEKANRALAMSSTVDEDLLDLNGRLRNLEPSSSQQLGIVTDSIDRVKEYGVNIAETALNSSCPLPGNAGDQPESDL